jgi:glycosyltransferase involved in cell wall biosynthesis
MRVLIIPSWYAAAGSESIAGLVFREHALLLRQQGIDAQVAYGSFSWKRNLKTNITFKAEDGVPTLRIRGWHPPKLYKFLVEGWIRKYANPILDHFQSHGLPDVIHAQGYQAGWVAEFIHQKTGIPFIITEHYSGFLQHTIPIVQHQFIKTAFDNAQLVTAVSPGLKEVLKIYSDNAIQVIPNYYNSEIFFRDPDLKKPDFFQWISIGEPIHVKGLDLLLAAFNKVSRARPNMNMRLVIADEIPDRHILQRLAERLEIEDKIDFAGLQSPDKIANLIRQSHVLVSSSRYETFGRTILEANACGIPVVATRTVGSSYIITSPEQGLLCDVDSVDALSQAMKDMVGQYAEYKPEVIQAAVASRFKSDDVVSLWINLYKELAHV